MSRRDWVSKYNLTFEHEVREVLWDGVPIPFTRWQRQLFMMLLKGGIPGIHHDKSLQVTISIMRSLLEDIGFPLRITNYQGSAEAYKYVLVPAELGVPEKGGKDGSDAASRSPSCL